MTLTAQEAESQIKELIERAQTGEEITITRDGRPVVRMVATSFTPHVRGRPILGTMRGSVKWVEGWEKPMTDEEADEFYGD